MDGCLSSSSGSYKAKLRRIEYRFFDLPTPRELMVGLLLSDSRMLPLVELAMGKCIINYNLPVIMFIRSTL